METKSSLAIKLSKLKVFTKANFRLEQYPTDSEVAADLLWNAYMNKDIEEKVIADLGCGTGILGIGCLLLGASKVIFVDRDEDVLKILKENLEGFDNYEIVHSDIEAYDKKTDVVIMNPPFGSKNTHADKKFLEKAFFVSSFVYSFHIAETRPYLQKFSSDQGFKMTHFWEYDFPLKKTMSYHKKRITRIRVVGVRFEKK
jgi:putative methylase